MSAFKAVCTRFARTSRSRLQTRYATPKHASMAYKDASHATDEHSSGVIPLASYMCHLNSRYEMEMVSVAECPQKMKRRGCREKRGLHLGVFDQSKANLSFVWRLLYSCHRPHSCPVCWLWTHQRATW